MAKYKVGDKVRVRSDLKLNKPYSMDDGETKDIIVSGMMKFSGEVVTINNIICGKYKIEGDCFTWTDAMFEGLAEQKFHEFDTVKHSKYGIGTVVSVGYFVLVDFDEWNEDFEHESENLFSCHAYELQLIQAYSPN